MDSCCNNLYNNTFDQKRARKELSNYLKKGVKKNSRVIISPLLKLDLQDKTLLDIGGGSVELIFELSGHGLKQVTYVEISDSYTMVFRDENEKRNLADITEIITGDFVDHHSRIKAHDLVTLDKVICCYEDYQVLVNHAIDKATRWIAYSVPDDKWWVKLVHKMKVFTKLFIKNSMRTYIHPVLEIEQMIAKKGFIKIYEKRKREWLTLIFERN